MEKEDSENLTAVLKDFETAIGKTVEVCTALALKVKKLEEDIKLCNYMVNNLQEWKLEKEGI